jgi:hypothetical protein
MDHMNGPVRFTITGACVHGDILPGRVKMKSENGLVRA